MYCSEIVDHVTHCKICMALIQQYQAQRAGSTITNKKQNASRENGKLGGRPKNK